MASCALHGHGDCFNCRFGIHISQGLILLVCLEQQQQGWPRFPMVVATRFSIKRKIA
jgi:hypothetical protein